MTPPDATRWKTLSPQLDHLLDLSSAEREQYLNEIGVTDLERANELRTLLNAAHTADETGFLTGTVPHASPRDAAASLVGMRVGAYVIRSRIGHGGMGSVWLAERTDGRFKGRAAVKLLNLSLVGQASAERFQREGSILARLSHPNIARLIDAGLSGTGQPYLILEYVDGVCIDEYCRDQKLDERAILRLFTQLLPAVSQAHAQLIVHRDIKPGNVMVSAHFSEAQLKLLDFGVAGFAQQDSQPSEVGTPQPTATNPGRASRPPEDLTQHAGHALTVNYASPEQLRRERVTTASDVYSLGVLLYALLTGRSAYRTERRTNAALEDAILKGDVLPLNHPTNATTFRIHRDLEAIVFKAMALQIKDRYDSVTSLKDEIDRYLSGKPVRARGRSSTYLATAFAKRHWLAISSVVAAFVAVSLAAFMIWAESEALKLTKAFLIETLTPTSYYSDGGGLLSQRDLLLRAANQVDTRFKDKPKAAAELYQTIGESLFNMGEHQLSYEVRTKAQPLIDLVYGATSREAIRNAARATYMHLTMYRYDDFKTALRALRARCGVTEFDTPNPKCLAPEWMSSMHSVSVGRSREAVARWTNMDARLAPLLDESSIWHTLVGYWGATASTSSGDLVRSKQLWQRLLAIPEIKNEPKGNHQYSLAIARTLNEAGFRAEAATLARTSFDQGMAYMGEAFDKRLFYLPGVVNVEISAGMHDQAEQNLLRALDRAQSLQVPNQTRATAPTPESGTSRAALGLLYAVTGRHDLARQRLTEALTLQQARSEGYDEWAMRLRIHLAAVDALADEPSKVAAQLIALRGEADAAGDFAGHARINALLSLVATETEQRETAWRSATDWMQTSHARMPDIQALGVALGSTRAWPPPIEDAAVIALRSYAAQILEATQQEMQSRPTSVQTLSR